MQEAFLFLEFIHFPANVTYTWLIMGLLIVLSFAATAGMKLYPNKVQNVMEVDNSRGQKPAGRHDGPPRDGIFPADRDHLSVHIDL